MEKINIAEILKDCPSGMELYSPIFGKIYLNKISPHLTIVVTIDKEQGIFRKEFLYDGRYEMNGECMLFPSKDQRDWNKFQRPFQDGDIVAYDNDEFGNVELFIFKEYKRNNKTVCYLFLDSGGELHNVTTSYVINRLATEEEKQKLFNAIKENGYKWNAETKTLEKLVEPKFKVGNIIQDKDAYKVEIIDVNIDDECYGYRSKIANGLGCISFKDQDNWELISDEIKPKFKVGDRIKHKVGREEIATVVSVKELYYNLDSKVNTSSLSISLQHEWELVSNKFDISTLVPFESKVLVRDYENQIWKPAIWGFYNKYSFPFQHYGTVGGNKFAMCIPYENNKHLLGTTKDCEEFYKTWNNGKHN